MRRAGGVAVSRGCWSGLLLSAAMMFLASACGSSMADDDHALRVSVQNPTQLRQLLSGQPLLNDQSVYCDAVRLNLVFTRTDAPGPAIHVNSVSIHEEPVDDVSGVRGKCTVDPLSSRPYGIVETEAFLITTLDNALKARFIKDAYVAFDVDSENLLRSAEHVRAINLKTGDDPVAFDILLETKSSQLHRIWFTIDFDQAGEVRITTTPILIWR